MGEYIAKSVHEKDMEMMRKLTRIVFNKWYTDLLQENLKVVPDLDYQQRGGNSSVDPAEAQAKVTTAMARRKLSSNS